MAWHQDYQDSVLQVDYIPVPRIEYTDDALNLVVENLTLSGRNLFPNVVNLETHNHMQFSLYKNFKTHCMWAFSIFLYSADMDFVAINKHKFILTLGQIQADTHDVAFYFRRKSGIPKLKDLLEFS